MISETRTRWLLVAALAALTVTGAWLFRHALLGSTRQRLVESYQDRLASLPERDAARLIQRLAQNDDQWLEVLVCASADDRPLVSTTAERELQDLIDQWSSLPPQESASRVAMLASLLAEHAVSVPPERRQLAHSLAQRLILWPVDGRRVDAAIFIADCQSVLLLPLAEQAEIRIAAVPEIHPAQPAVTPPAPELQQPPLAPVSPPIQTSSAEPRPFMPSPSLRVSER